MFLAAEHFARAPEWRWWILVYFFLAGLSGGCFALATLLRFSGDRRDEPASRLGFLLAFPLVLLCPVFLIVDLGQPLRFWHMMFDPAQGVVNFRYWSPMSLGVWGLLAYSFFAFVAFLHALAAGGRFVNPLTRMLMASHMTPLGFGFDIVGTVLALFIMAYTGVLLSVSNQPVWSDSFALGGLFLASGMCGAGALMMVFARRLPQAAVTEPRLAVAERYFAGLEAVFLVVFLVTLATAGTLGQAVGGIWLVLWLVVLWSLLQTLTGMVVHDTHGVRTAGGWAGLVRMPSAINALLTLIGVLALRAAVIWSAQA